MVGVVGGAVAEQFGVDGRASGLRMVQILKHEHRSTLGHDEAVPAGVEWSTGRGRVVVAGGEDANQRERAEGERGERGLDAAGKHRCRAAITNEASSFP